MREANDNIIIPYKDRVLDYSKPVKLYRNLNKKGVWYSLIQNGLTVAHTSAVCLDNCLFIVNEKTRQRVLATGKKEFHAYILGRVTGSICATTAKRNDLPAIVKYDPFKHKGFTVSNLSTRPYIIKSALGVICNHEGVRAGN